MNPIYRMPTLTCNRLMLLLAMYRGSPTANVASGTYATDIYWLFGEDLLCPMDHGASCPNSWGLTPKGPQLINDIHEGANPLLGVTTRDQLMLLLAMYRGSPLANVASGTYATDIQGLFGMGLICGTERGVNCWDLTPAGTLLINDTLKEANRLLGITTTKGGLEP